jgi:uncharacterized membrane protein
MNFWQYICRYKWGCIYTQNTHTHIQKKIICTHTHTHTHTHKEVQHGQEEHWGGWWEAGECYIVQSRASLVHNFIRRAWVSSKRSAMRVSCVEYSSAASTDFMVFSMMFAMEMWSAGVCPELIVCKRRWVPAGKAGFGDGQCVCVVFCGGVEMRACKSA